MEVNNPSDVDEEDNFFIDKFESMTCSEHLELNIHNDQIVDDMNRDWHQIPDLFLSLLLDKLINIRDYIRFSVVSKSWRSIYIETRHLQSHCHRHCHRHRQLPLLMIHTQLNHDEYLTRNFYSLTDKRASNFQVPVPYYLFCPSSSYGWLVTVSSSNYQFSLLNPFTTATDNEIFLPPLADFQLKAIYQWLHINNLFSFLAKVVLSANPTLTPNYVVLAIYGHTKALAFFKPGDKAWTKLSPWDHMYYGPAQDVIYCKDKFYFVDNLGQVFAWDVNYPAPKLTSVAPFLPSSKVRRYLVESSGHLLQVLRHTNWKDSCQKTYLNAGFDVFMFDSTCCDWIKMDNLQGHVLFLGHNSSLSLLASNYPECKPNSIYFTDDYYTRYQNRAELSIDMGVFNVEDGTTEPLYLNESIIITQPPFWIEPPSMCCDRAL